MSGGNARVEVVDDICYLGLSQPEVEAVPIGVHLKDRLEGFKRKLAFLQRVCRFEERP